MGTLGHMKFKQTRKELIRAALLDGCYFIERTTVPFLFTITSEADEETPATLDLSPASYEEFEECAHVLRKAHKMKLGQPLTRQLGLLEVTVNWPEKKGEG